MQVTVSGVIRVHAVRLHNCKSVSCEFEGTIIDDLAKKSQEDAVKPADILFKEYGQLRAGEMDFPLFVIVTVRVLIGRLLVYDSLDLDGHVSKRFLEVR